MFYKGDSVKIIKTGDRNYGKFSVVQGIKTAMEDKWVLVQIDGEQEYYQKMCIRDRSDSRRNEKA